MASGTEKRIILFPKTPVSQLQEFNRVAKIRVASARITVIVSEGILVPGSSTVIYEFDYQWRPVDAALEGTLEQRYREMEAAGKLPKEDPTVIAQRLMRQVKVITPAP